MLKAIISIALACWNIYCHYLTEGNRINYVHLLDGVSTTIIILKEKASITLSCWSIYCHYHTKRKCINYTCLLEYLLPLWNWGQCILTDVMISITLACWSMYYHYHTEGNSIDYASLLASLLPLSYWRQSYQLHLLVGVFTSIIVLKVIASITLACWSIYCHYHTEGNSINYACLLEYLLPLSYWGQ